MTDKISMGEVFSETIHLIKKRIRYISVMIILMLVIMAPFDWGIRQSKEMWTSPLLWVVLSLSLILATMVQVSALNNFIETQRGANTPLIPQGAIGRGVKTLFEESLVVLAVFIPGIIVLTAVIVGMALVLPADATGFGSKILWGIASSAGILLGFGVLGVRWGAGIAAAAVGEKISFKDSWRMTKGHTLSLLVYTIPMFLVPNIGQKLINPEVYNTVLSGFTPGFLALSLLSCITYWFSYVAFSVWYVKLTQRYKAMRETHGVPE